MDVAVDPADNVYVSDYRRRNVFVFDREGRFLHTLAGPKELENPVGLAYDPKNDRLLVADSKANKVLVYGPKGGLISKFGEAGEKEGQFRFPTFLDVGPDGLIYIVDTLNFRVQVFDSRFQYYDDFGVAGDSGGQFSRPKGIALDSQNNIYVVDAAFGNIQISRDPNDTPEQRALTRTPVTTLGFGARVNLFGYMILRFDLSYPQGSGIPAYWTISIGPPF